MKMNSLKKSAGVILALVILLGNIGAIKVDAANNYNEGAVAGLVVLDSGTLNIRQGATTASGVVGSLTDGDYIMIVGLNGNFYKVMYDTRGYYGYVSRDFVYILNTNYYLEPNIDSGSLNMREAPGTGYAAIASIPKGTPFGYISDDADHYGWYFGVYANVVGYTSTNYTKLCLLVNPN